MEFFDNVVSTETNSFISTEFNPLIVDVIDSLKSGVSFEASSLSFSEQLRLVNSSYNDRTQDNLSELLAPEMIFLTELLLAPEAMTTLSAKYSSKPEIMQIDQTQVSTDTITGLDKNQSATLAAILESTASNLGDFADSSEFIDYINLISNFSWNQDDTRTLLQNLAKVKNLPDIRIVPFNHLKAKGAFGNDTIFLSQEFFESNIDSPQKIVDVVSEELGHYLDSKLSEEDSPGDEGAIFSSLLKKESLTTAKLLDLKTENDYATLHVEGEAVSVELADEGSSSSVQEASNVVAAINAGGAALTQNGIDFAADTFFLNGITAEDSSIGNSLQPSFDGTIYQTERYGKTLNYEIPVAVGNYTVELYFSEIFWNNPGERIFDVEVEGQLVLEDLDLLAETDGDINQPFVFQVPDSISPDTFGATDAIDLDFRTSVDNAKISGIVVRSTDEAESKSAPVANNDSVDTEKKTPDNVTHDPKEKGNVVRAINAGGAALTQNGIDFAADTFFLNGITAEDSSIGNSLQPSFDGTIYQTERYGKTLNYEIPVAVGNYTVELYFSEIFWNNPGERIFDVEVEGQLVLEDLDLLAETDGDINQPFVFQVPDSISPDTFGATDAIDLDFRTSVDNAKISGIVVRSTDEAANIDEAADTDKAAGIDKPADTDELVELLIYDMSGSHEGRPSGVPEGYDWATGPRLGMGNDSGDWNQIAAWGHLYEDAAGNPATNTRVHIKDIQTYILSKQDGNWYRVQDSKAVEGAAWRTDYINNVNKPADIRNEREGTISVTAGDGYNFHFWSPEHRVPINPDDIAGVVTTVQARLIVEDPQLRDDRSEARYLLGMGADYWADPSVKFDDFKTNADVGIGKFKYVTSNWQHFTMTTLSPEEIRQTPPPINGFSTNSN